MPDPTAQILICKGCGATEPGPTGSPTDRFPSEHCGDCPPWHCADCGGMCSAAVLCRCWIDLTVLPLADIKAIFARDGGFNLGGIDA